MVVGARFTKTDPILLLLFTGWARILRIETCLFGMCEKERGNQQVYTWLWRSLFPMHGEREGKRIEEISAVKILLRIRNGTLDFSNGNKRTLMIKIVNFVEIARATVTYDLLTPARFQSILECKFIVDNSLPKGQRDKSSKYRETLGRKQFSSIKRCCRTMRRDVIRWKTRVQDF